MRKCEVEGVKALGKNGMGCGLVTSKVVVLVEAEDPRHERSKMDTDQVFVVVALLGEEKLIGLGIL